MRKFLKDNILDIFSTLYDAHKSARKLIEKNILEGTKNILADCQETAIQIGDIIDSSEGEGLPIIKLLENYCEALYQVSESLSAEYNGFKAQKALDAALNLAENNIRNEIKTRLEVVFMPYKSSMWDCLESIWKAADADPNCDAYVVPIPYYERGSDNSLKILHYEGKEYPDYVPVVYYESYDLAARKPDIIYIHNPYDDRNFVTSVDPRFYSSELKKHTNCLVYVPYFVLNDLSPDSSSDAESIKHFILCPGIFNANKVIVQSENIRKIYINTLLGNFGNTSSNRAAFEKKVLGLGSPKIDKVLTTRAENVVIPDEWKNILFREDGSRKKTIMYNTGITALLERNEEWIRKIERSLCRFKEIAANTALIWRPHPLIESTMKSMRPDILQKYLEIKENFIREGWGILDASGDLDRAIALSDGYYGDGSSVIPLFVSAKKHAMIQNIDLTNMSTNEEITAPTYSAAFLNNELWYLPRGIGIILRYSLEEDSTNYAKIVDANSLLNVYTDIMLRFIVPFDNLLYIFPSGVRCVYIYDALSENVKKQEITYDGSDRKKINSALSYHISGDTVCFIHRTDRFFTVVSLNTFKGTQIKYTMPDQAGDIIGSYLHGENVYCVTNSETIVIFNIKDLSVSFTKLSDRGYAFSSVAGTGDNLFFYDSSNGVLAVSTTDEIMSSGSIRTYDLKIPGAHISALNNGIITLDNMDSDIITLIGADGKIIKEVSKRRFPENSLSTSKSFLMPEQIAGENCYIDSHFAQMYVFDPNGDIHIHDLRPKRDLIISTALNAQSLPPSQLVENELIDINFLSALIARKEEYKIPDGSTYTCGEAIHRGVTYGSFGIGNNSGI